MGKGDQKTTRGKRFAGSYGKNRKRKKALTATAIPAAKPKKVKTENAERKPAATTAKKPAAKKPAAKKTTKKVASE